MMRVSWLAAWLQNQSFLPEPGIHGLSSSAKQLICRDPLKIPTPHLYAAMRLINKDIEIIGFSEIPKRVNKYFLSYVFCENSTTQYYAYHTDFIRK